MSHKFLNKSDAADAKRLRWLLDGNGYFLEENQMCGLGGLTTEGEKDEARKVIDIGIAESGKQYKGNAPEFSKAVKMLAHDWANHPDPAANRIAKASGTIFAALIYEVDVNTLAHYVVSALEDLRAKKSTAAFREQLDAARKYLRLRAKEESPMSGTTSFIQRKLNVGCVKAHDILAELERTGFVTGPDAKGNRQLCGA